VLKQLGAAALGTLPANASAAPTRETPRWIPATVADRLALTRRALCASQNDFARHAGVSIDDYRRWESGDEIPIQQAAALSSATGVSLDWIYCGSPDNLRYHLVGTMTALA
jgi:hypothetical protein